MPQLLIALLAFAFAHASEIQGSRARILYNALQGAGLEPDGYAGGQGIAANAVRCTKSSQVRGDGAYHCQVEGEGGGSAPAPAAAPATGGEVDRLEALAAEMTGLLERGDTRPARQTLGRYERELSAYARKYGGNGGDFAERLKQLQLYLICEETQRAGSGATSEAQAKNDVLYGVKVKDERRLALSIDCGVSLAGGTATEFDTPGSAQQAARALIVAGLQRVMKGTLSFRQHPKTGRWKLWKAVIGH